MSVVQCIFCQNKRVRAKEHIWPRWLQIKMTGGTKWLYSGIHRSPIFLPISIREHTGENLVLGPVCSICNSGWMANIENNFIPILDKIILPTDEVKALSKEEKRKVALWGFKTSLVINAGSNYRRLAPNEQFQHLYDYKSISKDVQVDLAYIKNYKQLEWQQSPIMFAMGRRLKDDMYQNPLQLKHDSFCIAMQIGNLGIRVSWFKESKNRGYTIISTNQEKTLRIWPYEKNPLFNKQICFEELSEFQMSLSLKDKYS